MSKGIRAAEEDEALIEEGSQIPTGGETIGALYSFSVLGTAIDHAYVVSLDFGDRPQFYQEVRIQLGPLLEAFQAEYGTRKDYPNAEQRTRLLTPFFGESDVGGGSPSESQFRPLRDALCRAAADYLRVGSTDPRLQALLDTVKIRAKTFQTYVTDVAGSAARSARRRIDKCFGDASEILRCKEIGSVFGVAVELDDKWPLEVSSSDGAGARLIEAIGAHANGLSGGRVYRDRFLVLQRIAQSGRQAIKLVCDGNMDDDAQVKGALPAIYTWGRELGIVSDA